MLSLRSAKRLANLPATAFLTLFALACLLPMLLVVMVSFTDEGAIREAGYRFIPARLSLDAYATIFTSADTLGRSYLVSIVVTTVGTLSAILITGMAGYTLANKRIRYRNGLALFFFVTMVFNPGIVPWYIMCFRLGLQDNLLALIVPNLIFNPFNLFLVRNFMAGIPDSLMESASIDGAGDGYIAFRIYFPLSVPVLAAVALFYGLAYWNDWWNAIMLVNTRALYPLQFLLFKLQSDIQMLRDLQQSTGSLGNIDIPTESVKMATVVVTIGPIIFLYPLLQRYFVKGLVIGAVKG